MSQKKVCRQHGHVMAQCRCMCSDRKIEMDCMPWCPDYDKEDSTRSSQNSDNDQD